MKTHDLICPECGGRFNLDAADAVDMDAVMCPSCRRNRKITVYSLVSDCPYCGGELSIPVNRSPEDRFCCPRCGKEFLPPAGLPGGPEEVGGSVPPQILENGTIFEKYRIIRLLGRGGMAEVYLAEHQLLRRRCALKLMIEKKNVIYQKRFLREARCVRDLSHPNIVRVFDAGCDPASGRLFIAMEYVEGTPLSDIAGTKLPERDLLSVASDMAHALEALEAIHVVHRDIKPSNIIRDKNGVFKLMDLGIAKTAHDDSDEQCTLTVERTIFGTPSYASPEQCRDSHRVDTRSDIYSLGATLYHLASGRCPYHGATAMETILKVLQTEPEPLTKLRRDLSRPMQELISKMLWKDPARRPQTAEELEKLIADVRAGKWRVRSGGSKFMKIMLAVDILLLAALLLTFVIWKSVKWGKAASAGENRREGSIEERIGRGETRLRELRSELQRNGASAGLNEKIRFRDKQLRRLKEQLAVRERARHLDRGKFNAARTKEFQRKFAELTRPNHNYGFPDVLMDELRSGEIDPNVEVVDSAWPTNSGPLLKCIASGRTYKAAEVAQVLVARGADTACMVPDGKNMTSYGVWPIVLTQGGFDAMTGCLLPFLKLHPIPEKTVADIIYLNHRVDERDDSGNTALHYAARAGMSSIVSLLLLADADVNARNDLGETPLFGATKNDRRAICEMLIRAGADPGIRNKDGRLAADMALIGKFRTAVSTGNSKGAAELLKAGIDPDTRFGDGYTALQTACLKKDPAMVKVLLDGGADPDLGRTSVVEGKGYHYYPLQVAFWRDSLSPEIFAMLLKKDANPNIPPLDCGGTTLLVYLCEGYERYSPRDEEILLDALLDSPRTEPYVRYFGNELSILSIALRHKRPLWFARKIAARLKTLKSTDPVLADAVDGDYPEELIRELIAGGANVNAVCSKSRSVAVEGEEQRFSEYTTNALFLAVENKRADIVRLLLAHGADREWQNSEGKTVRDLDTTPEIKALLK